MVRDLNRLLAASGSRARAEPPDVAEFLAKHGSFFPGARDARRHHRAAGRADGRHAVAPAVAVARAARRAAGRRSTRCCATTGCAGTSPSWRRTSTSCCPAGSASGYRFGGDQPLGLEGALEQLGRLQALDGLETELDGVGSDRATWPTSTGTEVADLLGADAARDLDALEDLAQQLEQAGYLDRDGDRLELTPRGSRRIGQKVLDDLFARLRQGRVRGPPAGPAGRGGDREETSKPFKQ